MSEQLGTCIRWPKYVHRKDDHGEPIPGCTDWKPVPAPAEPAVELLCKVTGNTCGSDTWPKGLVCPCEPCQSWLQSQPAQAKPTRTVTHQMARNAFRKMHDALHNSLIHPAIVRFARRRYPSLSIPARLDDADIVLSDYICQQRDLATPPPADPAKGPIEDLEMGHIERWRQTANGAVPASDGEWAMWDDVTEAIRALKGREGR